MARLRLAGRDHGPRGRSLCRSYRPLGGDTGRRNVSVGVPTFPWAAQRCVGTQHSARLRPAGWQCEPRVRVQGSSMGRWVVPWGKGWGACVGVFEVRMVVWDNIVVVYELL